MEKSVIYNGMKFVIDGDLLVELINPYTDRRDIFIPHRFSSGEEINDIGSSFIKGAKEGLHKVRIDDRISKIHPFAFQNANVDEVIWPTSCLEIPKGCFSFSSIHKILNIDNIVQIKEAAFDNSGIRSMVWPSKCKAIPRACFASSKLESISNIDHVVFIEDDAFLDSWIIEIKWPSECKCIPNYCFCDSRIKRITNLDCVMSVGRRAFSDTYLSEPLDFSKSSCSLVGFGAFGGLDMDSVILPYYMNKDSLDSAFVPQY